MVPLEIRKNQFEQTNNCLDDCKWPNLSFFNYYRNVKACTMCQVSTTCFSKYLVCLKRPSLKLLDSLQQEVCITYLNHLLWWYFPCLWICSIDGSIRDKKKSIRTNKQMFRWFSSGQTYFFLVIKELSKHVQWAKCWLLVFQRTIFV